MSPDPNLEDGMTRFQDDQYYPTTAPELALLGTRGRMMEQETAIRTGDGQRGNPFMYSAR